MPYISVYVSHNYYDELMEVRWKSDGSLCFFESSMHWEVLDRRGWHRSANVRAAPAPSEERLKFA